MGYYSRLTKSFENVPRLPLTDNSKYVLISDCHRGIGTSNDNFLKNQNLYFAALTHYYESGYTYIELGDGDELWENSSYEQIIETHSNVFWLLSLFFEQDRLYMLYGNHDIIKKYSSYTKKNCSTYACDDEWALSEKEKRPLFPDMPFYSGIILEGGSSHNDIYLTHGHQGESLNSTFWMFSRFLVRHLWKPLEHYGVLDPTSAAKNYTRKHKTEHRLQHWAQTEDHILITGHTHRPALLESDRYYYNAGSCVHPRCITCLEIEHKRIRLVKWTLDTRPDMVLYVSRQILAGPVWLDR